LSIHGVFLESIERDGALERRNDTKAGKRRKATLALGRGVVVAYC
jgi:hypothetical protein